MRHLGTARTGAYFSVAPFFGTILALLMGEALTLPLLAAGALMAFGVWLYLTEQHTHEHVHHAMWHMHTHVHDVHHQHEHDFAWDRKEPHSHPHYPDARHQHHH